MLVMRSKISPRLCYLYCVTLGLYDPLGLVTQPSEKSSAERGHVTGAVRVRVRVRVRVLT